MKNKNIVINVRNLAIPIVVENLLFMLLGFIDVFALSQVNGTASAAAGTANQIISLCNILFSVIASASTIIIAQCLGAGKRERASTITALSLTFNTILGIVISIIIVLFNKSIIRLIGAQDQAFDYATKYLAIVGIFLFGQSILNSASSILRSHGYTKISMYIVVTMNIINTVLDLIFIFYFKWDIVGVAIATSFSKLVGLIAILIIVFTKIEKISVFKRLFPLPVKDFIALLKIGVPSALESLNYNLSQLVVTSIVLRQLSDNEYIAKNYVTSITMFFYIFSLSIGQASQIVVSHKVGNKEFDSAYKTGKNSFITAFILSMFMCLLGIVFREQLLGIFASKDTFSEEIIKIGSNLIILNIFLEMGRTVNLVIINCLKGAGDVIFPTGAAIFSMWVLSTLLAYILAVNCNLGINGLWIAFACDECFRGILMLMRWKSGKWRLKSVA